MALELTPLGKFVKWILVPVSLGAIGFYILGPKVGPVAESATKDARAKAVLNKIQALSGEPVPEQGQPKGTAPSTGSDKFKEVREKAKAKREMFKAAEKNKVDIDKIE